MESLPLGSTPTVQIFVFYGQKGLQDNLFGVIVRYYNLHWDIVTACMSSIIPNVTLHVHISLIKPVTYNSSELLIITSSRPCSLIPYKLINVTSESSLVRVRNRHSIFQLFNLLEFAILTH